MTTLALNDTTMWTITLLVGMLQFVLNVIFGLVIWVMTRKAARIDQLEARAEESARDLIDERMATLSSQFIGAIDLLKQRVDQIVDRLSSGDADFRGLAQRDHDIELKFNMRIEQLKDWTRENFASKHHVDSMQRRLDQLSAPNPRKVQA